MLATTATGVDITGNAVLSGELRGPASFVIDPAAVGNNTGTVVIKGDLTVEGTTTTVNSTTLDVADKNITVASGSANAAAANGAGITVDVGTNSPAVTAPTITYNATSDRWEFNKDIVSSGAVFFSSDLRASNASNKLIIKADGTTTEIHASGSGGIVFKDNGNGQRATLSSGGDFATTANISAGTYTGITLGGSLSGNYTDAKVQYGNSFVGTPAQGHFFFDGLNQKLKVYTGSAFVDAVPASGGGGGGSGSSDATATFRKYTYTLASSTNAVSGMEDDIVATTNFISGRKYQITTVGNTDFTAIGAGSNAGGVVFISTGVGGGTTGRAREVLFYATGGTQNIEVYVNGVKAVEGSANDYVATTGTSVTFTSNLAVGDVVDVQVYELLTNDSYYLKSEVYTKAETNTQITTGTSSYLPLAGGTLTGVLAGTSATFDGGIDVDNFNIDGTTLGLSSGDLTIDSAAGDIILDAHGNQIILKGSSGQAGFIDLATGRVDIKSSTSDSQIRLQGNDGGTPINALVLDMADAGKASFNAGADFGNSIDVTGDINAQGSFKTDQVGVSSRPSLLLDFANSKSLDPSVTFARSSTARYYDGHTTAKAGENLRKYSEDFTNAYWTPSNASWTSNQTAAPDGATTADKAIINSASGYHDAYTNQEHTNTGEYHTHSVYVKQGTGIPSVYMYTNVGSGGSIAKFNITNGTYIGNASGNGYNAFASHSIQDVGGGWYRISSTYLETSSTYRPFTLGFSNATTDVVNVITGNGTDHFFAWGSQVERSNGPTEYIKTDSSPKYTSVPKLMEAPANTARFDHDPYTGESKGLLIESSRTNLLTESVVKASVWYTSASLFDENSGVAPDGTLTATTVYSNGASNVHRVVGATANSHYTLSVYAKKSDAGADTTMGVYLYASGTTNDFIQHTTFNLVTGEIVNANVNGTTGAFSRIYPVGNGWYRLSVTGQMPASISQNISSGIMYTPSQPNAAFLLWGAQLENSRFHTSYIPTSGSTVSRTQDNGKIENIDTSEWYSRGKGTTYIEAANGGFTTSQGFMSLYQIGYGNDWHGYYGNTPDANSRAAYSVSAYNVRYTTSVGGGNSSAVGNSNYDAGVFFKGAQTWNSESMSYAFDGLATSANADRYATEHNTLNFSQLYESGFHAQFVHIKKFAFYPQKMTEAQVKALTE